MSSAWSGSGDKPYLVPTELAIRAFAYTFRSLSEDRRSRLMHGVQGMAVQVENRRRRGPDWVVDFDSLSSLVRVKARKIRNKSDLPNEIYVCCAGH